MAQWSDIVTEMNTITTAFSSVSTFIYDRLSSVNVDRGKSYPAILLESVPDTQRGRLTKNFLPGRKQYTTRLFLFDTYDNTEKASADLKTKQASNELLLDQFIAEFIRRYTDDSSSSSRPWQIINHDQLRGSIAHDVHSDKLIQSHVELTIEVITTSCTTGTFNY